ncbi:MAG: hypoxanthine phosphoribosyltransferase [bacterium]|nr:hypoxanthine phosphoribosyltransferase [bacterium]
MDFLKENSLEVYLSEDEIQAGIKVLAEKLNKIYGEEELYVVCVLKGAVMFATDLVKYLKMPVKMEFIRLSSYGSSYSTSGNVNAVDISLPNLNEKNVLIVEDIIDTGLTAKFLIDFIKNNFQTKTLKFCSLLDKMCKRKVDIDADYYCFEVDDKFLVGYGLDLDGYGRNIPNILYKTDVK